MAIVEQLIRVESDGTLSFGNYLLAQKAKVEDFPFNGSSYKVKTYDGMTKLEKDGMFSYESVPGTCVRSFSKTETGVEFYVSGKEDSQLTVGLSEDESYRVYINGEDMGEITTNTGGKLNISVELEEGTEVLVRIIK